MCSFMASTDNNGCSLSLYFRYGSFCLHQWPQTTVPQHANKHTRAHARAPTRNGHRNSQKTLKLYSVKHYNYTHVHLWVHTYTHQHEHIQKYNHTHTLSSTTDNSTQHTLTHKDTLTITDTSAHTYRHTPCQRRPLSSRLTPPHHGPQFKPLVFCKCWRLLKACMDGNMTILDITCEPINVSISPSTSHPSLSYLSAHPSPTCSPLLSPEPLPHARERVCNQARIHSAPRITCVSTSWHEDSDNSPHNYLTSENNTCTTWLAWQTCWGLSLMCNISGSHRRIKHVGFFSNKSCLHNIKTAKTIWTQSAIRCSVYVIWNTVVNWLTLFPLC